MKKPDDNADAQVVRTKHRMAGDFDLASAGYFGVRKLTCDAAVQLQEMDIHVRTLQALAAPHAALSELVGSTEDSDTTDAMIATLWTGIVVQYCRCFESTSKWHLKADDVFPSNEGNWREQHSSIVTIRSKHVAHDLNNLRLADVGIEVLEEGKLGRLVRAYAQFSPAPADLITLAVLIGRARSYAEVARRELIAGVTKYARKLTDAERLGLEPLRYESIDRMPLKSVRRPGKSAAN